MMKKIIYLSSLVIISIWLLVSSCRDNSEKVIVDSNSTKNIYSKNARFAIDSSIEPLATIGGELDLSSNQIEILYNLTTLQNSQNLRSIILYTTGNENGTNPINLYNLVAISLYHYKDGKLEHCFYKKDTSNNQYHLIPELTYFCLGTTVDESNFAIFFSNIYIENKHLSIYSIKNKSVYNTKTLSNQYNLDSDYTTSYDFLDFRASYLGKLISLNNEPENLQSQAIESLLMAAPCRKCTGEYTTGSCTVGGSTNNCRTPDQVPNDGPICPFTRTEETLPSNNDAFNKNIAYYIRDNILRNSIFGMKYYEYYYNTSFYDCNIDLSDAVKITQILPKIYTFYNNVTNNNSNEIIFDTPTRDIIISLIENLKNKNSNKANFIKILTDVENDTQFLTNKTVGEFNEIIY